MEIQPKAAMQQPHLHLYDLDEINRHKSNLETIAQFPKPGYWLPGSGIDSSARVAVYDGDQLQRLHGWSWATSGAENLTEIDRVVSESFQYLFDTTREDQLKMKFIKSSESPKSREQGEIKTAQEGEGSQSYDQVKQGYEEHMLKYSAALEGLKNLVDVYTQRYQGDASKQDELDHLAADYTKFKSQFESVQAQWSKKTESEERDEKLKREIFYAIKDQHTEGEISDPSTIVYKEIEVNHQRCSVPEQVYKDFFRIGKATVEIGGRGVIVHQKEIGEKKVAPRPAQEDLEKMVQATRTLLSSNQPISQQRALDLLGILTSQTFIATVSTFARHKYGGIPIEGEMPPFNLIQIPETANYTMHVEGDQLVITKSILFDMVALRDIDGMEDVGYSNGAKASNPIKEDVRISTEIRLPLNRVTDQNPNALKELTEDQVEVSHHITRSRRQAA